MAEKNTKSPKCVATRGNRHHQNGHDNRKPKLLRKK